MLDFGWPELLLILAVIVFVTGPQDIPKLLYQAGRMARRVQYLRFTMSDKFDAFMREHDLQELRKGNLESAPGEDEYDERAEDEMLPLLEENEKQEKNAKSDF